ncbi:MAG: hypothetical protein R3220_13120, partial [Balneolaceae bacterium]|nr:hypothetical protein [Balneolaceae bacterium]
MTRKNSPKIATDIDLSPYNTLGVSAVASTFVNITSRDELSSLHSKNFFEEYTPFILGGGSNILFLNDPSQA